MNNASLPVSDTLSNFNDQLVNAAGIVGRSKIRQSIFEAVYSGKKQVKTVEEIAKGINLSNMHVLKEARKMHGLLIEKVYSGFKKKRDIAPFYKHILGLARDKKKLEKLPTKISPHIKGVQSVIDIKFPSAAQNAFPVTIDDIDSFSAVKGKATSEVIPIPEEKLKNAFKKIVGEQGDFKDWGGEELDLYTSQVQMSGKRITTAFAFKGAGIKGTLVPARMGKNGDQISRLFKVSAQMFLIVYCGKIAPSVIAQMQAFAIAEKALLGQKIFYGVIDGNDVSRLVSAYPNLFNL